MSRKHQKYRRHLLNLICKNLKNSRRHKLSITHKLNVIEFVLREGISWMSLNKSSPYKTRGDESTYRKFFYKLCETEIFKTAINNFIITIPKQVYIDTTTILNKSCRKTDVDYCSKDKKHKGIKISTYCDNNRFVYLPVISKANVHDIKLLEPTLDINVKPMCLVGDKGYISSAIKTKLKNNGTELVYPYRNYNKSSKLSKNGEKKHKKNYNKNTDEDKIKLKKRHLIENIFASLKQFKRLGYIFERNINYFRGFVYLACYLMNSNVGYNFP